MGKPDQEMGKYNQGMGKCDQQMAKLALYLFMALTATSCFELNLTGSRLPCQSDADCLDGYQCIQTRQGQFCRDRRFISNDPDMPSSPADLSVDLRDTPDAADMAPEPSCEAEPLRSRCATRNQICAVSDRGPDLCGVCVQGHLPDEDASDGRCRPQTCDDLACQDQSQRCNPRRLDYAVCEPIFICDNLAQVRAHCESADNLGTLTSGAVLESPDRSSCYCQTLPNTYWDLDTEAPTPCDADRDGWVRHDLLSTLQIALAPQQPDQELLEQMRCVIRVAEHVRLRDELGRALPEPQPLQPLSLQGLAFQGLPLIEQTRLDTTDNLDGLMGNELNATTRACLQPDGDYNANGLADIDEGQSDQLLLDRAPWEERWAPYSHFLELHRDWFSLRTAQGGCPALPAIDCSLGSYIIQEKPRDPDNAPRNDSIDLLYPGQADYWRRCLRHTDAAFDPTAPPQQNLGFDFATRDDNVAMLHHSQFRCLRVVDDNTYQTLANSDDLTNNHISPSLLEQAEPGPNFQPQARRYRYALNQCSRSASHPPIADNTGDNPANPDMLCQPITTGELQLDTRPLVWGLVQFIDHQSPAQYLRGCVNECQQTQPSCAGPLQGSHDSNAQADLALCAALPDDFGRSIRLCASNRSADTPTSAAGRGIGATGNSGAQYLLDASPPSQPSASTIMQGQGTSGTNYQLQPL